jgi:hypothetical protein
MPTVTRVFAGGLPLMMLAAPAPIVALSEVPDVWATAARNADQASEPFQRCHRLMTTWYRHKGAGNHLLPQNLGSRQWTAENSAADLWSFFVITAYLTDQKALDGDIRQTLRDEIRLTTRVGRLPDAYFIDQNRFVRQDVNLPRIVFGASEYAKDGLLPIVELMGRTAWFTRIRDLLEDIFANAPVKTKHGDLPGDSAEVNGEMLQNLCRFYSATGDPRYKAWAERIGDAYFLDMLPKNNDLPCHAWDFAAGRPRNDVLSLSDHGNEIVFGLSELAVLEHVHDQAKAGQYLPAMRRMLDKLLSTAVNEDGLWVRTIQPSTGKVLSKNTPDTWGYALDAVYAFYMITGERKYRDAVHRALKGINAKPKYREWGGADAFADSIEGGIVLLNRIPELQGFEWLEKTVRPFLAKQRKDGIVEGWHGDGNYARTALMYALMKTAGTRVTGWRPDVKFGAAINGKSLHVLLTSEKPWQGRLHFDVPRHRLHLGLTINYPRLNEFPEWYTVEPTLLYRVSIDGKQQPPMLGDDLARGLSIQIGKAPVRVTVTPADGPPYGGRALRIEAPQNYGSSGAVRIPIVVHNDTGKPQSVRLSTSFGKIEPGSAKLSPAAKLTAIVTGKLSKNAEVRIEVKSEDGEYDVAHVIGLVYGKDLVGYQSYSDEEYKGRGYLWSVRQPVECTIAARRGRPHTIHLLWGAKDDQRTGFVVINGERQTITHGGYDGFKWLTIKVPADEVTGETIRVKVTPASKSRANAPFISEIKATSP